VRRPLPALLVAACAIGSLHAGEIPGAAIVLETAPGTPGSDPTGAPPRFVLLKDGQVFVSGTSLLEAGRLEKGDAQALVKRAAALRKLPGVAGSPVAFGGAPERSLRLKLFEDDPLEIEATGDPASAPVALAPLASLVSELLDFRHPSLKPYAPSSYAVRAREAKLAGGCRPWAFSVKVADAMAGPHAVSALDTVSWPTGAMPASVCVDDRRYAVTLRPLLPGEQP
jgi:hypothetical protein